MIERMKIIIPKTTNPNHHAPIHLGSRVVNSVPSGCKQLIDSAINYAVVAVSQTVGMGPGGGGAQQAY